MFMDFYQPINTKHMWKIWVEIGVTEELHSACPNLRVKIRDVEINQHFFMQSRVPQGWKTRDCNNLEYSKSLEDVGVVLIVGRWVNVPCRTHLGTDKGSNGLSQLMRMGSVQDIGSLMRHDRSSGLVGVTSYYWKRSWNLVDPTIVKPMVIFAYTMEYQANHNANNSQYVQVD